MNENATADEVKTALDTLKKAEKDLKKVSTENPNNKPSVTDPDKKPDKDSDKAAQTGDALPIIPAAGGLALAALLAAIAAKRRKL